MLSRFLIISLSFFLAVAVQTVKTQAQCGTSDKSLPRVIPTVRQETYNQVLEILFPVEYPQAATTDFFIALRFQPSFSRTSQIIIRNDIEKTEVIEYTADVNVYDELNKIFAQTCRENPEEMAKLIKIQKKPINISSSKVKQWHTAFLRNFAASLDSFRQRSEQLNKDRSVSIVLDGTFYQLWYMQGGDRIKLEFYDVETDDLRSTGNFKVVQWMNTVRREVRK